MRPYTIGGRGRCYKIVKVCGSDRCWVTYSDRVIVTNYFLCPGHMREHLTPVSITMQQGSTESCKEVTINTFAAADEHTRFPCLANFAGLFLAD